MACNTRPFRGRPSLVDSKGKEIAKLYDETEITIEELARVYDGCHPNTIRNALRKFSTTYRHRPLKQKGPNADTPGPGTGSEEPNATAPASVSDEPDSTTNAA